MFQIVNLFFSHIQSIAPNYFSKLFTQPSYFRFLRTIFFCSTVLWLWVFSMQHYFKQTPWGSSHFFDGGGLLPRHLAPQIRAWCIEGTQWCLLCEWVQNFQLDFEINILYFLDYVFLKGTFFWCLYLHPSLSCFLQVFVILGSCTWTQDSF